MNPNYKLPQLVFSSPPRSSESSSSITAATSTTAVSTSASNTGTSTPSTSRADSSVTTSSNISRRVSASVHSISVGGSTPSSSRSLVDEEYESDDQIFDGNQSMEVCSQRQCEMSGSEGNQNIGPSDVGGSVGSGSGYSGANDVYIEDAASMKRLLDEQSNLNLKKKARCDLKTTPKNKR